MRVHLLTNFALKRDVKELLTYLKILEIQMVVSQCFLHFPYGARESYNLINITKLSTVYLR